MPLVIPILLVAFNEPYDCLANNEFGWVPLVGDPSIRRAELQRLLEGSAQWRKIVEAWALSGDVDFEIDDLRSYPIGLLLWSITAEDEPEEVRRAAEAVSRANAKPVWVVCSSTEIDVLLDAIDSTKVLCQPFSHL